MADTRRPRLYPTRSGWAVLFGAGVCFVTARILGAIEIDVLAAALLTLFALAFLSLAWRRPSVRVERTITPSLLRVGLAARVDVVFNNRRTVATPVLLVEDRLDNTVAARVHLAPLRNRARAVLAYRLLTPHRGEPYIGPLDLIASDAFGLIELRQRLDNGVRTTVRPALMQLAALRANAGFDPSADLQPERTLSQTGDEFYALRPYVPGDEPRRVHWKASARSDDLVVRQDERPRSGRVTVVLDTTRSAYGEDPAEFDRACSVAISALTAAWRGGDSIRFLTSVRGTVSDIVSRRDLEAIDERLAVIDLSGDASLLRCMDELGRAGHGGTVVVISGRDRAELATTVASARRSFSLVVPVACSIDSDDESPTPAVLRHDGLGNDFEASWKSAIRRGDR